MQFLADAVRAVMADTRSPDGAVSLPPRAPSGPAPTRWLLVVEDDGELAGQLQRALARRWQVAIVSRLGDALAAVARAQQEGRAFELVLYDLRLPDCEDARGIEALLRQDARLAVVVFTGTVDEAMAQRCLRAGAADYIVKGVSPDYLRIRMEYATARIDPARALDRFAAMIEGLAPAPTRRAAVHAPA